MAIAAPILIAAAAAAAATAALERQVIAGVLTFTVWGAGLMLLARSQLCTRVVSVCVRTYGRLGDLLACFACLAPVLALGALAEEAGRILSPAGGGGTPGSFLPGAVTALVFGGLALYAALLLLRRTGPRGWITVGALAALCIVALQTVGPFLLSQREGGERPAPASPGARALMDFARRGGVRPHALFARGGADPLNVDAEGAFGAVHVSVSQGALDHPAPETFAALGHLLGHLAHWDYLGLGLLLGTEVLALAVGLALAPALIGKALLGRRSPPSTSPAALPLLALTLWALFPAGRLGYDLFDQFINYRADAYAVTLTGDRSAVARWVRTEREDQPPDPDLFETLFFYDHPPLSPRLAQISKDPAPGLNPVFAAAR